MHVCVHVYAGENANLKASVSSLEIKLKEASEELRKAQIKMSAITEYFQQKEMDLHSKLEAGQQTRKKIEVYANEALDKDRAREEEKERERKELDNLRRQMKEIEISYISQAKNHEKRAEESSVSWVWHVGVATCCRVTVHVFVCSVSVTSCRARVATDRQGDHHVQKEVHVI